MNKHFEIIDQNAIITWDIDYSRSDFMIFVGVLYWNYSDMTDTVVVQTPLKDLKEFDDVKESMREILLRRYKHKSITE